MLNKCIIQRFVTNIARKTNQKIKEMMKGIIVCVRIQYDVPSFQHCSPEEGNLDEGKADIIVSSRPF
jgi:hypothetical protein